MARVPNLFLDNSIQTHLFGYATLLAKLFAIEWALPLRSDVSTVVRVRGLNIKHELSNISLDHGLVL